MIRNIQKKYENTAKKSNMAAFSNISPPIITVSKKTASMINAINPQTVI